MGTTRLGIFPSLDNKHMYDMIDRGIVTWFLRRFPNDFFKHVFIDNQSSTSNNFVLNKDGELTPVNTAQEIQNPYMRVTVRHGKNNQADVFGTDVYNVLQQPGAFSINTDLTGYRPIYMDPFHVIVSLNERTVKRDISFQMTVQTKSDQIGLMNYLDTFMKMNYVQTIDIDTTVPMHNLLMEYLRACIFKPEIAALDKTIDDSTSQLNFKKDINEMFMSMMFDYSQQHIIPFKSNVNPKDSDGNEIDTRNYSYCYNQVNRVYLKLEKYEDDEGSKQDGFYEKYTVTINGSFDVGVPISFITSVPAIIRGTRNNWYMKTSENAERNNYYHMIQFKEVFQDNRHKVLVNSDIYKHFYFEREIMMSSVEEHFNIIDDVIDLEESPSHYYVMSAILRTIKDQKDFNTMFKVVIYKDDDPIPEGSYSIDEKFNFTIHNCSLSVPYYIEVFVNRSEFTTRINEIKTKLENMGIDWWSYFDRAMKYEQGFEWFMYTIRDEFRKYFTESGIIPSTIRKYKYRLNPHESNIHVDRGYRGIGYIPKYYLDNNSGLEFMSIMPLQFLTPDPANQYYTQNDDGNMIPVTVETVDKIRERLPIFIKVAKKYVECDINKILIADPEYKYFTYDRHKDIYVFQKDIKYFDPIKTYFIPREQYKFDMCSLVSNE